MRTLDELAVLGRPAAALPSTGAFRFWPRLPLSTPPPRRLSVPPLELEAAFIDRAAGGDFPGDPHVALSRMRLPYAWGPTKF